MPAPRKKMAKHWMTIESALLAYAEAHPRATAKQVAKPFGFNHQLVIRRLAKYGISFSVRRAQTADARRAKRLGTAPRSLPGVAVPPPTAVRSAAFGGIEARLDAIGGKVDRLLSELGVVLT